MKIALGTVQWGLDYGISNTNGIPSEEELNSIFIIANKAGIDMFDTAVQYGNAEKRVGEKLTIESNIVTKIGSFSKCNCLNHQLENSFKNLQRENIYGCLFHNSNELNKDLWEEIFAYKKSGRISKIGYSLYEPSELLALLEVGLVPDLVQVPYSLLDRKFEPYFEMLKGKGVEIHVRSVFLQGLYFNSIKELDPLYYDLREPLKKIQFLAKRKNLSVLELALSYVTQNKFVDYAVLGVETAKQLEQIILATEIKLSQKTIKEIKLIQVQNKVMLNPVNWK